MRPTGTRGRALLLLGVAGAAIAAVNGLDLPLTARRLKLLASGEPLYALAAGTAVAGLWMAWRAADTRDHASGGSTS